MIIFFSLEINSDVVSECIISNEERLLNCIDKKKNQIIILLQEYHYINIVHVFVSFLYFSSWYGVRVKKFYPCFKIFKIFWQAQEKELLQRF